jgi:hypothetical protein
MLIKFLLVISVIKNKKKKISFSQKSSNGFISCIHFALKKQIGFGMKLK